MMVLKRKGIVLGIIAIMILVAGYINWAYQPVVEDTPVNTDVVEELQEVSVSVPQDETAKSSRAARDEAREKSRKMLQDIINDSASTEESKTKAQSDINAMASAIEKEGLCEGALIAKGMSDAVVFISDGKASVYIKSANEITGDDIAKIKDIVVGNTGINADNIKISTIE